MKKTVLLTTCLVVAVVTVATHSANVDLGTDTQTGRADFESVGALAFGPEGILFVADSMAGSILALDTEDAALATGSAIAIDDLGGKLAALLGTTEDQVQVHDLAVNPRSKKIYLSVSRGQGDTAAALILRLSADGTIEPLDLDNIRHSRASLANAPEANATDRRGRSLRLEAITDLAFVDGELLVAGLSNEEFASKLRVVDFPFDQVSSGASVDIYHGSHGRWETYAPVRTMALFDVGDEPHVLAAYTCTPLVTFPVAGIHDEDKLEGRTVAELGNRNRPLDMVVYERDGNNYALMANSSRGVMKVDLGAVADVPAITEPVADKAGLGYTTLADLEGVQQLDRYNEELAVLLLQSAAGMNLHTLALP